MAAYRESECGGIRVCRESKESMTQWQPTGNQNVEGSGCVGKVRSQWPNGSLQGIRMWRDQDV